LAGCGSKGVGTVEGGVCPVYQVAVLAKPGAILAITNVLISRILIVLPGEM
jgi:hypothetical protein